MAKQTLKTGKLTFDAVEYGVTAFEVSKNQEEIDVTHTESPAGRREFLATGREGYDISITIWKDVNAANLAVGTAFAGEIDFEGFTYSGDILFLGMTDSGSIDEAIEQTYTGRFTGAVTETPAV